jgi:glycosyltransferase involved in cell wall biosynthesis
MAQSRVRGAGRLGEELVQPLLSIVVICHNMAREAPRTLYSLSRRYQRGIEDLEYEVIVVDNGSSQPLTEARVVEFGPEFRHVFFPTTSPSPVAAINAAVEASAGRYVVICIDGARIVSPGMLRFIALATRLSPRPVIGSLAWHLGSRVQKLAMLEGYDQDVEDRLLAQSGWEDDGYRLFSVACLANSSGKGWFRSISECNCICVSRSMYRELGGFDERFVLAGGGYANLDFYKRACEFPGAQLITLLGEGTFHQFHGGAATNARPEIHPGKRFADEYLGLRGMPYANPDALPIYLGTMPRQAIPFLRQSAEGA